MTLFLGLKTPWVMNRNRLYLGKRSPHRSAKFKENWHNMPRLISTLGDDRHCIGPEDFFMSETVSGKTPRCAIGCGLHPV
jgi:hypothetical protein